MTCQSVPRRRFNPVEMALLDSTACRLWAETKGTATHRTHSLPSARIFIGEPGGGGNCALRGKKKISPKGKRKEVSRKGQP